MQLSRKSVPQKYLGCRTAGQKQLPMEERSNSTSYPDINDALLRILQRNNYQVLRCIRPSSSKAPPGSSCLQQHSWNPPHRLWNIFPGTNAHKSVFISRSGSHTSSNPSLETLKTQTQCKKIAILLLTNIACKAVEALTFSTALFPATQTHLQPLSSPCSLPESTHSHMQTTLDPRCATPNKPSRDRSSPFPWRAPTAFAPQQLGLSTQPFHPKSGYLKAAERYLLAEPGWVLLIGGDNARKPEDGDEEK